MDFVAILQHEPLEKDVGHRTPYIHGQDIARQSVGENRHQNDADRS